VEIGPADTEVIGLQGIIKKLINASKTYSRWVGKPSKLKQ